MNAEPTNVAGALNWRTGLTENCWFLNNSKTARTSLHHDLTINLSKSLRKVVYVLGFNYLRTSELYPWTETESIAFRLIFVFIRPFRTELTVICTSRTPPCAWGQGLILAFESWPRKSNYRFSLLSKQQFGPGVHWNNTPQRNNGDLTTSYQGDDIKGIKESLFSKGSVTCSFVCKAVMLPTSESATCTSFSKHYFWSILTAASHDSVYTSHKIQRVLVRRWRYGTECHRRRRRNLFSHSPCHLNHTKSCISWHALDATASRVWESASHDVKALLDALYYARYVEIWRRTSTIPLTPLKKTADSIDIWHNFGNHETLAQVSDGRTSTRDEAEAGKGLASQILWPHGTPQLYWLFAGV